MNLAIRGPNIYIYIYFDLRKIGPETKYGAKFSKYVYLPNFTLSLSMNTQDIEYIQLKSKRLDEYLGTTYAKTQDHFLTNIYTLLLSKNRNINLDMSTVCRRQESPRLLSGTSAHPTMVTLVNIINGWLTSFSFHVNRPSNSWDKDI